MKPLVAVIAQGAMGAGVARRLTDNGIEVRTLLAGRSQESVARAGAAGMTNTDEDGIAACDLILSIVPPGEALSLAQRLRPALTRGKAKPVYVDCNAVSPETVRSVAEVVAATDAPFVDAGIIGGPPKRGARGPTFYASGAAARDFAALSDFGLHIRVLDGPVGIASALKMSYAGITKGLTALATTMALAATRGGVAELLAAELAESQPSLADYIASALPGMLPKAYRWVAEMREIAAFIGDKEEARILKGAADLYERIAADFGGDKNETRALSDFVDRLRVGKPALMTASAQKERSREPSA